MKSGLFTFLLLVCAELGLYASVVDTSRWTVSALHLNSGAAEFSPLLSADGQTMYFVRRNHIQNIGEDDRDDIWVSYRDSSGMWSNSVNIGAPLNNERENKVVGVSLNNETLYLTGDRNDKIYVSGARNRTWSKPMALELPDIVNETPTLNCHVSIDESNLMLALGNKDCLGKRDLFVCRKDPGGNWSKPLSLGPEINTMGDEANVFLAADNKTLYFCTNGREGFGGYDWFISRRLDETWTSWSTPVNLGAEVNTSENDQYFCINTELQECYGAVGLDGRDFDIKRILLNDRKLLPDKTHFIYGKVQTRSGEPVSAPVDIHYLQQTKPSSAVFSKPDGRFIALLSDQQSAGFYATQKSSFAVLAYTNLTDIPLKVLDNSGYRYIDSKDSIHLYNTESIQIRLNELDRQLYALKASRPQSFSPDLAALQKYFMQSSDFEVNQNIEKLRIRYNTKYGKKEFSPEKAIGSDDSSTLWETGADVPSAEDLSHTPHNPEKIQQMKKVFEEQKTKKEIGKSSAPAEKVPEEISEEEARRAIEELGQINAVPQKAVPDFEVLVANMKNRIAGDEFENVKADLEKDLIWEWNGWKEMGFRADEEKKMKGKVQEIQEQLKTYFDQRNRLSHTSQNVDRVLYEDDKIIYDELRNSVVSSMYEYMKEDIKKEIDHEMKYRLCAELKNQLAKNLEKVKRPVSAASQPAGNVSQKQEMDAENDRLTSVTIQFYPLTEEINIPISGIFYQPNSDVLLPESNAELNRIKHLLESNPALSVEIGSHTHGYCSDAFADDITARRCASVKRALVALGADPGRIFTKAYGKKMPMVPNNTKVGRLKNQRTEMRLMRG